MCIITVGPFSAIMAIRLNGDVSGDYDELTFDPSGMGRCLEILVGEGVMTNGYFSHLPWVRI